MHRLSCAAISRLRQLIKASTPYSAICAEIGCTKSTVSYYSAKMGLARTRRKHDWTAIRDFYEAGHSARATRRKFSVFDRTWQEAIKRGDIVPRPRRAWVSPLSEVMLKHQVNRPYFRKRLVREGFLVYECAFCGINTWRGLPLSLELDHIDGNNRDNRLENLRLLCPNCHSQTETFSGRNIGNAVVGRSRMVSLPD